MPDVLHSCAIIFELQQYLNVGNNNLFFKASALILHEFLYKEI